MPRNAGFPHLPRPEATSGIICRIGDSVVQGGGLAARDTLVGVLIFRNRLDRTGVNSMLYWAFLFFIVALVAALFGFSGIAAGAAGIAKILFFVFLVLFIISLIAGGMRRPTV